MVLLSDLDATSSQSVDFADGFVSDLVLGSSQSSTATWLPVRGDLVSALVELSQRPGFRFVSVGETADGLERSYYLARAAHDGEYLAGYCAFHLTGARIRAHGRDLVATKYEVLVGGPDAFRWQPATHQTVLTNIFPVEGGWCVKRGTYEVGRTSIARYRSLSVLHYGSLSSEGAFETFGTQPYPETDFEDIDHYEVLAVSKATDNIAPDASPAPDDQLKVMIGRYYPNNHWGHVKKGDRYSTAVTLPKAPQSVPKVVMGFDYLDISNHGSWLRLRLYPQNITRESFICNQDTWHDTVLHNCGATWAVIDEPGWQTGAFRTKPSPDGSSFDDRITFSTPFTSPPMVFVCFDGFDLSGLWDVRVMATSIDRTGFSITVVKPDAKVAMSYTSWIAIPVDETLKREKVWMGRFTTSMGRRVAGKDGEWSGNTKFGIEFKRAPRIFLGVDQLSYDNEKYLRLSVSTSKVSKSGMDWYIKKWNNSILRNAGVSFLAFDCE